MLVEGIKSAAYAYNELDDCLEIDVVVAVLIGWALSVHIILLEAFMKEKLYADPSDLSFYHPLLDQFANPCDYIHQPFS